MNSPSAKIGWVKLHRSFLDWEWYTDLKARAFFLHCLLRANHSPGSYRGVDIGPGEFTSTLMTLSSETGLTIKEIRTVIKKLKKTNDLEQRGASDHSLFRLVNWEKYQQGADEGHAKGRGWAEEGQAKGIITRSKECKEVKNNISAEADEVSEPKKKKVVSLPRGMSERWPLILKASFPGRSKRGNAIPKWKSALQYFEPDDICNAYLNYSQSQSDIQFVAAFEAWCKPGNIQDWIDQGRPGNSSAQEISQEEAERRTQRAMERHREECRKREEDKSQDWRYR